MVLREDEIGALKLLIVQESNCKKRVQGTNEWKNDRFNYCKNKEKERNATLNLGATEGDRQELGSQSENPSGTHGIFDKRLLEAKSLDC